MRTAWLILEGPVEYEPSKESGFEFPIGIMAVFPSERFSSDVPTRPKWAQDVPETETYETLLWVRRASLHGGWRAGPSGPRGRQADQAPQEAVVRSRAITGRGRRRCGGPGPGALARLLLPLRIRPQHRESLAAKPAVGALQALPGNQPLIPSVARHLAASHDDIGPRP